MNKLVTVKTIEAVRELHFKQQGITLVALVVTIIVLLILAGVTITSLLGDDGIIAKAQRAADETNTAVQREQEGMNALLEQLNNYGNGNSSGGEDTTSIPEELERYILGEDKTGILMTDVMVENTEDLTVTFKDNEIIPDASTSITYLGFAGVEIQSNLSSGIAVSLEYKDNIYTVLCDGETITTLDVIKPKITGKKKIFEGPIDISNIGSFHIPSLTEKDFLLKKYMLDVTINGEQKILVTSLSVQRNGRG